MLDQFHRFVSDAVHGVCQICGEQDISLIHDMESKLIVNNATGETWVTKDSGERQEFSTGMKRDIQKGKPRFDLCWKPLYWRWAELMGRGAEKYGENNWMKAATEEELNRFKASAERHLQQLLKGDTDEDHAAAVLFNVAGIEYVKERMNSNVK